MNQQLPVLIIAVPLLAAFVIAAAGWINRKACFPIALVVLGLTVYATVAELWTVLTNGAIIYKMSGWAPPWGISLNIDHLNALVLVVVAVVSFINLVATRQSVKFEFASKTAPFYSLYILFITGLLGIVATGDAFNLYVLLEIASLTGYALIGMGKGRAPLASLNYIIMGTIGASLYLLGIGYLYLATGSLNMADLAALLPDLYGNKVVVFAFVICMGGLFVKMALFPFHTWLPNAYTFAPSASTSLIAPLTTKVMIYVMIRICLTVFTPEFCFEKINLDTFFVWLSVGAIIMGSIFALAQKSLKKMLTYIVIAEVGYMVGGFWLGNRPAITGSILHIVNDAVMTLCIFLAAGNIISKTGSDAFKDLKGLFRKMPFTMSAFALGALSIIGVPPTCGFFSKWYLISGGIAAGHYGFVVALLFSSLVNVILFFRIFEIAYFEPFSDHHDTHEPEKWHDVSLGTLIPLLFTAILLIALGVFTGNIVTEIIQFAIPTGLV